MRLLFIKMLASIFILHSPLLFAEGNAPREQVIRFGIVPQQSPSQTAKTWEPLLSYLSQQIGVTLRFQTARDISTFEERVSRGDFDIIYVNPYHYTIVHKTLAYSAFATEIDRELRGIIIVAADSPLQHITELNKQKLAVPGLTAFAATQLPMRALRQQNIIMDPIAVSSHESVMLAVARGIYAAGGINQKMLNDADPKLRGQLRILWRSDAYTPHPFAAHPRVDPQLVAKLLAAMRAMTTTPEGQAVLKETGLHGFGAINDQAYDAIRLLDTPAPHSTKL